MIKRIALLLPLVVTTAVLPVVAPGAGSSSHSHANVRTGATITSAALSGTVTFNPTNRRGQNWGENWSIF